MYNFKSSNILHLHNLHGEYFSAFALPELTSIKHTVWTLHDMQAFTGHCAHSYDCDKWLNGCGNCPYLSVSPSIKKDTTKFLLKKKPSWINPPVGFMTCLLSGSTWQRIPALICMPIFTTNSLKVVSKARIKFN